MMITFYIQKCSENIKLPAKNSMIPMFIGAIYELAEFYAILDILHDHKKS